MSFNNKKKFTPRRKFCRFCADKDLPLDYKRVDILRDFITERGKITLRCHTLERRENDFLVQFEVEDTGAGIPPDDLGRLFQSFEQADNSATRKHGGTGLGLAITKRIAELMGGTAGARSEVGKGSTFWLTVRLHSTSAEGRGAA